MGIVGLNLLNAHGNTYVALVAGVVVPALFAALLGLIMFFARLGGVYIAILMLVVSLMFELFLLQTADPSYTNWCGLHRRLQRIEAGVP